MSKLMLTRLLTDIFILILMSKYAKFIWLFKIYKPFSIPKEKNIIKEKYVNFPLYL